jgi:hypothetical protein
MATQTLVTTLIKLKYCSIQTPSVENSKTLAQESTFSATRD